MKTPLEQAEDRQAGDMIDEITHHGAPPVALEFSYIDDPDEDPDFDPFEPAP